MAGNPKTRADLVVLNEKGKDKVEELLTLGRPLEDITKELGVSRKALYRWLDAPEQAGLYARARARAADELAEQALAIADQDGEDVPRDRLRVDTRKWLASKWNPQQYGDQKGVNVQINLADLHLTAVRHASESVIDVTPVNERDSLEEKPSKPAK